MPIGKWEDTCYEPNNHLLEDVHSVKQSTFMIPFFPLRSIDQISLHTFPSAEVSAAAISPLCPGPNPGAWLLEFPGILLPWKEKLIDFLEYHFRESRGYGTYSYCSLAHAYVLRYWRLLQNESEKDDTMKACHLMKVVIMELFAKNGWRFYHMSSDWWRI